MQIVLTIITLACTLFNISTMIYYLQEKEKAQCIKLKLSSVYGVQCANTDGMVMSADDVVDYTTVRVKEELKNDLISRIHELKHKVIDNQQNYDNDDISFTEYARNKDEYIKKIEVLEQEFEKNYGKR